MSDEDANKEIRAKIVRFLKILSCASGVYTNVGPTKMSVSILFTEKNMNEGSLFAKTIETWMRKAQDRLERIHLDPPTKEDIEEAERLNDEIQNMLKKQRNNDEEEQ